MQGDVICQAIEVFGDACMPSEVHVCEDRQVSIYLNGTLAGAFDTCPQDLEALAHGYLLCEGLIASASAIESTIIGRDSIAVQAGREACQQHEPDPVTCPDHLSPVDTRLLLERYLSLARYWPLCHTTGATHGAVIFTACGGAVSSAEDLHGFGAVSKAIGKAAMGGYDLCSCFLLFTGRPTPWTVRAAAHARLPLIVCCGTPSSVAIEESQRLGIGLIQIRGPGRMVIYHGGDLLAGLPDGSRQIPEWQLSPGTL